MASASESTMSSAGSGKQQPVRESCRIVTMSNDGKLKFEQSNLEAVLKSLKPDLLKSKFSFISIIGPRSSGKSFYTNLLIQYLRYDGMGWLSKLTKLKNPEREALAGFWFGNVQQSRYIIPDDKTSGIYMYPEPFDVQTFRNKQMTVWVLDVHYGKHQPPEGKECDNLEAFLMLICSRIVEIQIQTNTRLMAPFRLLHIRDLLSRIEVPSGVAACNSIVYMFRTNANLSAEFIEELKDAVVHLRKIVPENVKSALDDLKSLSVGYIEDSHDPLHNEGGQLVVDSSMYRKLEKIIKLIMEENDIFPKIGKDGTPLLLGSFADCISECIEYINKTVVETIKFNVGDLISGKDSNDEHAQINPHSSKTGPMLPAAKELIAEESKNVPTFKSKVCDDNTQSVLFSDSNTSKTTMPICTANFSPDDCNNIQMPSNKNFNLSDTSEVQQCAQMEVDEEESAINDVCVSSTVEPMDTGECPNGTEFVDVNIGKDKEGESIEQLLDAACEEAKDKMFIRLKTWTNDTVNMNNIADCKSIYLKSVDDAVNHVKSNLKTRQMVNKFRKSLELKLQTEEITFQEIHSAVEAFHADANRSFQENRCFLKSELDNILINNIKELTTSVSKQSAAYINRICLKLGASYMGHNGIIAKEETSCMDYAFEHIRKWYKSKLDSVISQGPLNPSQLKIIHGEINSKLIRSLQRAVEPKQHLTDLGKYLLYKDFAVLKKTNQVLLHNLQRRVGSLITAAKRSYDEKMDDALRKYPAGIEPKMLRGLHCDAQKEAMKFLKNEGEKVRQREPVDVHVKTLKTLLDTAWQIIVEENEFNIRKPSTADDSKYQNLVKQSPNPNMGKPQFAQRNSHSTDDHGVHEAMNEKTKSPSGTHMSKPAEVTVKGLIFQFSSKYIAVSKTVEEGSVLKFVSSTSKDERIPAVIGITKDSSWIYGHEVMDKLKKSDLSHHWSVEDCMLKGKEPWQFNIIIGDTSYEINFEFVLGFLLRQCKKEVEAEYGTEIGRTVIVIPFWLASSQRRQIRDAARVAGFSDVNLFNENTAIAYAFSVKIQLTNTFDVCVLSENSGKVDVTIYEDNGKKFKMISYFGGNFKPKQGFGRNVLNFLGYSTDHFNNDLANNVYEALSLALQKRPHIPRYIVIYSENDQINYVLGLVAEKFVYVKKHVFRNGSALQMQGAFEIVCHLIPSVVGLGDVIKEQLPYDIERNCDGFYATVRSREVTLISTQKFHTTLQVGKSEAKFYQKFKDSVIPIGYLKLKKLSSGFQVHVIITVTDDGIVDLDLVEQLASYGSKLTLSPNEFIWKTPNLDEEQILEGLSLIEYFEKLQTDNLELTKEKQLQLHRGTNIKQRIEAGDAKFRTALAKNLVLQEIDGSLDLLQRPNCSTKVVEKQMEYFDVLESKYFPN